MCGINLYYTDSLFFVRLFQEMGFFVCVCDKVSMFIMRFGAIVIQDEPH